MFRPQLEQLPQRSEPGFWALCPQRSDCAGASVPGQRLLRPRVPLCTCSGGRWGPWGRERGGVGRPARAAPWPCWALPWVSGTDGPRWDRRTVSLGADALLPPRRSPCCGPWT